MKNAFMCVFVLAIAACATARQDIHSAATNVPPTWAPMVLPSKEHKCVNVVDEFEVDGERIEQSDDGPRIGSVKSYGIAWGHPRKDPSVQATAADFKAALLPGTERLSIRDVGEGSFGIVSGADKTGYRLLTFDSHQGDFVCNGAFIEVAPQKITRSGEGWGGSEVTISTRFARGADGSLYVFQTQQHKGSYLLLSTSPTSRDVRYRFKKIAR